MLRPCEGLIPHPGSTSCLSLQNLYSRRN